MCYQHLTLKVKIKCFTTATLIFQLLYILFRMINVYEIDESVGVYGNSKLQVLYTVGFKMIKNFDTQVYEIQLALILNCVLPICIKGMFGKF